MQMSKAWVGRHGASQRRSAPAFPRAAGSAQTRANGSATSMAAVHQTHPQGAALVRTCASSSGSPVHPFCAFSRFLVACGEGGARQPCWVHGLVAHVAALMMQLRPASGMSWRSVGLHGLLLPTLRGSRPAGFCTQPHSLPIGHHAPPACTASCAAGSRPAQSSPAQGTGGAQVRCTECLSSSSSPWA